MADVLEAELMVEEPKSQNMIAILIATLLVSAIFVVFAYSPNQMVQKESIETST